MTLQEFCENPENVKSYQEWLSDPMTQTILALTEQEIRPSDAECMDPAGKTDLSRAAMLHAKHVGQVGTLNFIRSIGQIAEPVLPEEDYGADEILAEQGRESD